MSEHLHEDEQVEALKRWWDENGRSTLVAVALAVGGTFGWQQYQLWSDNRVEAASDAWTVAKVQLQAEESNQREAGVAAAQTLKEQYAGTTYARFAALELAALAVSEQRLDDALAELRWALAEGDTESGLGRLIQLRLARVLAASGDEAGALDILDSDGDYYAAAFATARGDIHLAAGRTQEALDAYLEARTATLSLGNPPGLLDLKIATLESRLATEETSS